MLAAHCQVLDPEWSVLGHLWVCVSLHARQAHTSLLLQAPPTEASSNAGWWREHLGRDLSGPNAPQAPPLRSHPVSDPSPGGRTDEELQRATAAWKLGGMPCSVLQYLEVCALLCSFYEI